MNSFTHFSSNLPNNMTSQPYDVSRWLHDDKKFSTLNNALSFRDDSQPTTTEPEMISAENSSPKCEELDLLDVINDADFNDNTQDSSATPILAPSYKCGEQSLPEGQFDESELIDPSKDPINEVTVTTAPGSADLVDDDGSESLTLDQIETLLRQTLDYLRLQDMDNSIEQRAMSVETQPPADLRPRYKSDGKRQIEKCRTTPMVIKLPDVKNISLETNQWFYLRLALITYDANPAAQIHLHPNKLEYHSDDMQELDDGTVGILLTGDDLQEGKKALPRLAIVRTKLGEYKPQLTAFRLSKTDHEMHENRNNNEEKTVPVNKAKDIYKQFQLSSSRIMCQLLIKKNESIHFTNITCETHVMHEKDQKSTGNKRSANAMDSDDSSDERPCTSKSKSIKRKKRV